MQLKGAKKDLNEENIENGMGAGKFNGGEHYQHTMYVGPSHLYVGVIAPILLTNKSWLWHVLLFQVYNGD